MNINFSENDKGEKELVIHCSKSFWRKEIVSIIEKIEGLKVISSPHIFSGYEFCAFTYEGYDFQVTEDNGVEYGLCYISSSQASEEAWSKIAHTFEVYITNLPSNSINRKTSKPLVLLLTFMLGVATLIGLSTMGYING